MIIITSTSLLKTEVSIDICKPYFSFTSCSDFRSQVPSILQMESFRETDLFEFLFRLCFHTSILNSKSFRIQISTFFICFICFTLFIFYISAELYILSVPGERMNRKLNNFEANIPYFIYDLFTRIVSVYDGHDEVMIIYQICFLFIAYVGSNNFFYLISTSFYFCMFNSIFHSSGSIIFLINFFVFSFSDVFIKYFDLMSHDIANNKIINIVNTIIDKHELQCKLQLFYISFPYNIIIFLHLSDIYTRKRNNHEQSHSRNG